MNSAHIDGLFMTTTGLSREKHQTKNHVKIELDNYYIVMTQHQASCLHTMLGETLELIRRK